MSDLNYSSFVFLFVRLVKMSSLYLTVLSQPFISAPPPHPSPFLLQTSAINREKQKKKNALIVDYINKNIFALSWTLIIYFVTNSNHQFFGLRQTPLHAMPFVLYRTQRASVFVFERMVHRVVSKYWRN